MTLDELLMSDAENMFEMDEFAKPHDINGKECLAIVEDFRIEQRSARKSDNYDGVDKISVVIHVRRKDLPKLPKYKQIFTLDGKRYRVVASDGDDAIATVKLAANDI